MAGIIPAVTLNEMKDTGAERMAESGLIIYEDAL